MIQILDISTKCLLGCGLTLAMLVPLDGATAKSGETVLYSFGAGSDGKNPPAGLIEDKQGNLYGTTSDGGTEGAGIVFELAANGTETTLFNFCSVVNCAETGAAPAGGLIMDKNGNLYGTTVDGGAYGYGTVFELAPNGTETVLYSFTGGNDGGNPYSAVITDKKGNLYGTAVNGGADNDGTVFKLAPDGAETVLHTFKGGNDGATPYAGLIADKKGNLYGATGGGGNYGAGTIFEVTSKGKETVLYSFAAGSDGAGPLVSLLMDKKGNLYGTTFFGGAANDGTVFELAPDGSETVLYTFCSKKNCADGASPHAVLIMDSSDNLYGTTGNGGGADNDGIVFKLAPDGTETVLHTFEGGTDGTNPQAGLIADKKGNLYGTTFSGGTYGDGTVFEVTK